MKKIWQWVCDKDILRYLLVGLLTTVVNYAVYLLLFKGFQWSAAICNLLAWFASVLFSFAANKYFVFGSYLWTWTVVRKELASFFACRIGSGAIETLILLLSVDILHADAIFWKLAAGGSVVLLNYLSSKLLVFRKNE